MIYKSLLVIILLLGLSITRVHAQPDVLSVTVNDDLITDSDVNAGDELKITVSYDKTMDTDVDPTLTFPTEDPTNTITYSSDTWVNGSTFEATYSLTDQDEYVSNVDVHIDGAEKQGNNDPQNPHTESDLFTINTTKRPEVTSLSLNDSVLTDCDVGGDFIITVVYDRQMDTGNDPSFEFPDEDPTNTINNVSGDWKNDSTYEKTYNILSTSEIVSNVDIRVKDAQTSSRTQIAYTDYDVFDINTTDYADAGGDITECGTPFQLDGSKPASSTGEWSVDDPTDDATFADKTKPKTQVTAIDKGTTTLAWTVTYDGCIKEDYVDVYNQEQIAIASANKVAVCNETVQLDGNKPGSDWTGVWSETTSGGGTPTYSPNRNDHEPVVDLADTSTTFTWTIENDFNTGCSTNDDTIVTNYSFNVDVSGKTVCTQTTDISATATDIEGNDVTTDVNWTWSILNSIGTITDGSDSSTVTLDLEHSKTKLEWIATYNGCSDTGTVNVKSNYAISDAGEDQTVCKTTTDLQANDPSYADDVGWTTSGSATIANDTKYNTQVGNLDESGEQTFTWTVSKEECTVTDGVVVSYEGFDISAGADDTVCPSDNPVYLNGDAPSADGSGIWTTTGSAEFVDETLHDTEVRNLDRGSNEFEWTVTRTNCSDSAEVSLYSNTQIAEIQKAPDSACNSKVTVEGNSPKSGWSGQWTSGSASFSDATSASTTADLTDLSNPLTWTISKDGANCSSSARDTIVNNALTVIASGDTVCTRSTDITAEARDFSGTYVTADVSWTWNKINGPGTISNGSDSSTVSLSDLDHSTTELEWEAAYEGCTFTDVVYVKSNYVNSDAGNDTTVCEPTTSLGANDPSYADDVGWTTSGSATIANDTKYNTQVGNLDADGDNTFKWTVSKGSCEESDNVVVSYKGFDISAGADKTVCPSENAVFLDGDAPSADGSGLWTTTGSAEFVDETLHDTEVRNLDRGSNEFEWKITRTDCSDSAEVSLYSNTQIAEIQKAPDSACNSKVTVEGNSPKSGWSGQWTSGSASFSDATSASTTADLTDLSNPLTWTISKDGANCSSSARDTIVNNALTVIASGDTVCTRSTDITAEARDFSGTYVTADVSWTWNKINGPGTISNGSDSSTVSLSDLDHSTTELEWEAAYEGCTFTDVVYVKSNYVNSDAGNDTTVCEPTTSLGANDPSYADDVGWTTSGSATIANDTKYNTQVGNLDESGEQTFTWTVSKEECTVTDGVVVSYEGFDVSAGADDTVCPSDSTVEVEGSSTSPDGTGTWTASDAATTFADKHNYKTEVGNLAREENTLTWSVSRTNCDASDDVILTNHTQEAEIKTAPDAVCDNTVEVEGNSPASGWSGQWSSSSATFSGGGTSSFSTADLENVNNTLTWTIENDADGCASSVDTTIQNNAFRVSASGETICRDSTTITANAYDVTGDDITGSVDWTWSISNAYGEMITSGKNSNEVTVDSLNRYGTELTYHVENKNCSEDSTIRLENNGVTPEAGPNETVCHDTTTLSADTSGFATGEWSSANSSVTFANDSRHNSEVKGLESGNNTLEWNLSYKNCSSSDYVDIYNARPTKPDAGSDETVCSNSPQLDANSPSMGTGEWTSDSTYISFADATDPGTEVNGLAEGVNTLTWNISTSDCSSRSEQVDITYVNPEADAGDDQSVCPSEEPIKLDANDPDYGSGEWYVSSVDKSPTFADVNDPKTSVDDLVRGDNILQWTVSNSYCGDVSDKVTIKLNQPSPADAGSDYTVCTDTDTLDADDPDLGSGEWTVIKGNATFADVTDPNTPVGNLDHGDNKLKWTVSATCSANKDTIILTNDLPTEAKTEDDFAVCGSETTIEANTADYGTGSWSTAGGASIANSNNNTTKVTGIPRGDNKFTWTIESPGSCSDSYSDLYVTNNNPSIADAGDDDTVCGDTVTLNAEEPTYGNGYWKSPQNVNFVDSTKHNTVVRELESDDNTFVWTVSNGSCKSRDTVIITNSSASEADAGPHDTVCVDTTSLYAVDPAPDDGQWTTTGNATFSQPSNKSTFVGNLDKDENYFIWTVSNSNCSNDDTTIVVNNGFTIGAGSNQTLCADTVQLHAEPSGADGTGEWAVLESMGSDGNIDDTTVNKTTVRDLGRGHNYFEWSVDRDGCNSKDTVRKTSRFVDVSAGSNRTVCEDTVVLDGTEPDSDQTGKWIKNKGSDDIATPTSDTTTVYNLEPDKNAYEWEITDTESGCEYSDQVVITSDKPTTADAGDDQTVCRTVTLSGNTASEGTGSWSLYSGSGHIVNPDQRQTDVDSLQHGESKFTWMITKGTCESSDTVIIQSNRVNANLGDIDTAVCDSDVELKAQAPSHGNGVWSTSTSGVTFSDSQSNTTSAGSLVNGNNSFKWEVSYKNCTESASIIVSNDPVSEAVITTGDSIAICSDETTLEAEYPSYGDGQWSTEGVANIASPNSDNTEVTGLADELNIFAWTVSKASCSSSDTIIVNNQSIDADAGIDDAVCVDTAQLRADSAETDQVGSWSSFSATIDNKTDDSTIVRDLIKGDNTFVWEVEDTITGCTAKDNVVITNNSPSEASTGSDQELCTGSTVITADYPNVGSGSWSLQKGSGGDLTYPDSNETPLTNLPQGDHVYEWTVTNAGCSSSDEITVANNSIRVNAGKDQSICKDSLTLNMSTSPSDFDSVRWYGDSLSSDTTQMTVARDMDHGENHFIAEAHKGKCSGTDEVVITNNKYELDVYASQDEVCYGTGHIQASKDLDGTWKVLNNGGANISSPSDYSTDVTNLDDGENTFRWSVEENGCVSDDDVTIRNNAVSANVEEDKTVCKTTADITAEPLLNGQEGIWSAESADIYFADSKDNTTTTYGLNSGTNKIYWKVTEDACSITDTLILYNNQHSTSAGQDQDVCGTETTLNANTPPSGAFAVWDALGDEPVVEEPHNSSSDVTNLSTGANTFVWEVDYKGCIARDTVVVTNNKYEVDAGGDQELCTPYATMTAKLPFSYSTGEWEITSGKATIVDKNDPETTVEDLGLDKNTFLWKVTTNGCTAYDTVNLVNNQIVSTAGNDTTICDNSFQLQADDPGENSGKWSVSGGNGVFDNDTKHNTFVRELYRGKNTFKWTVTGNGCSKESRVNVTNNSFAISAGEDEVLADGASYTMSPPGNEIPNGYTSSEWILLGGSATIDDPFDLNTDVSNLTTGINKFELTILNNGCYASDTVSIIVKDFDAYAGLDQTTCEDSVQLNGNDPISGATGKWSLLSGGGDFADKTDPNTWVTNLRKSTENTFMWTVTKNGVSISDTVVIQNNAFDLQPHDTIDGCSKEVMLNAEPAGSNGSGYWSVNRGSGNFSPADSHKTRVTNLSEGENEFIWHVDRFGCTDEDTVQVIYYPPPAANITASMTELCSGDTVSFTNNSTAAYSNESLDYFWEFGDDRISYKKDTSHKYTYINTKPGTDTTSTDTTYTVNMIATSSKGCTDTASQDITVYPKPQVGFTPDRNNLIHPNTEVTLSNESGEGYEDYIWDFDNGETVKQDSFQSDFTYVYDSTEYIADTFRIQLRVNNAQCFDTVSHPVTIIPSSPVAKIDTFVQGCAPLTVSFNNHSLYAEDYKWEFGNGSNSTEEYPEYTYYEPGEYVVSLKAFGEGGTDYVKQDTVRVHELPVAYLEAKPDSVMLPNQPVHAYSLSEGAEEYLWKFGDGDTSSQESPIHYYEEPGYYDIKLKVWSEYGCVDSIQVPSAVYVEEGGKIKFPNAFTPNLSGPVGGHYSEGQYSNDVFYPLHRGIETYTLNIYTRWGEMIFESDDPDAGWDGYYNGKLMPQGTYIWKVTGTFKNGEPFTKTGTVTLIQ